MSSLEPPLWENLLVGPMVHVEVLSRRRNKAPWVLSNAHPEKFSKTRKIVVKLPATTVPIDIVISVDCCAGIARGETCYLSLQDCKRSREQENQAIRFHCTGEPNECYCFLNTKAVRNVTSGKPSYKVSITVIEPVSKRSQVLYEWVTSPLKNHKFESTSAGITMNQTNAATQLVPLPEFWEPDQRLFYENILELETLLLQ